jgi:hypothetical protein
MLGVGVVDRDYRGHLCSPCRRNVSGKRNVSHKQTGRKREIAMRYDFV